MNNGFEIERKFLISFPDNTLLQMAEQKWDIEQIYLNKDESGYSRRIRRITDNDKVTYILTKKRKITDIRREELETVLSSDEFALYLKERNSRLSTITKTRYRIPFDNHIIEIDIYPFWTDRAILEVELDNETEVYSIPDSVGIIREVTGETEYNNSSLALSIPFENI